MRSHDVDDRFQAYVARDDDALTGSRFFEILREIERRRKDIESGRVVCKPIDDVVAGIREKLKDVRSQSSEGR